jgi:hypothetical protein
VTSSGSTSASSSGYSDSDTYTTSESEADIPIFFPVPFQELSTVQYYTMDEQLTELAAALKLQFQRHCFIQIGQQETQPMLVPFVQPVTTFTYSRKNLDWYIQRQHEKQHALAATEVDRLLGEQEAALLEAAGVSPARSSPVDHEPEPIQEMEPPPAEPASPIWNRETGSKPLDGLQPKPRKRGPRPDVESHRKVLRIVSAYGDTWTSDDNLAELCDELDREAIPVPKTWATRRDGQARSWSRARQHYPDLVIKAIKDRCKAAQQDDPPNP